jgi:hypothetical protein
VGCCDARENEFRVWDGEKGISGNVNGCMKCVYVKGATQKIQLLKVRILRKR